MELRQYVEILTAGAMVSESSEIPMDRLNEIEKLDPRAYGYRTFDRWIGQTPDGSEMRGERTNVSGITYFGREWTLEAVEREMPEARVLIDNMRVNRWDRVVECKQGFVPLRPEDSVIQPQPRLGEAAAPSLPKP